MLEVVWVRTHNNEETFARIADPLGYVEEPDVYELIQSIVAIQRDYGDRKSRKNSRMKYLLHRKGINCLLYTSDAADD